MIKLPLDPWVVKIGSYTFGPFDNDAAVAFADEHGSRPFPLWHPDERDAVSGKPAIKLALEETRLAAPTIRFVWRKCRCCKLERHA